MYINQNEYDSIDFTKLNQQSPPDITWKRDYQDERVIKFAFEIDSSTVSYSITRQLQELQKEIYEKYDFYLTGFEYTISNSSGTLVFSKFHSISPNEQLYSEFSTQQDSLSFPFVLGHNDIISITGAFVSCYEWNYTPSSITINTEDNSIYLEVQNDETPRSV